MIRAIPDIPAPPMPMKCTGRQPLGVRSVQGPPPGPRCSRRPAGARRGQHQVGEPLVRVAGRRSGRPPAPMAASRRRVGQQRDQTSPHPGRACSRASSTSSPPPAATTGSALSRCSPLPIGSGTYAAGQPHRGQLADRVRAGPAQHEVGRRRRPGPSGRSTAATTYGRLPVALPARRPVLAGPADVQHLDAGGAQVGAAAPNASFSRRAPCEPPMTSSVGRSRVQAERGAGRLPGAARPRQVPAR